MTNNQPTFFGVRQGAVQNTASPIMPYTTYTPSWCLVDFDWTPRCPAGLCVQRRTSNNVFS